MNGEIGARDGQEGVVNHEKGAVLLKRPIFMEGRRVIESAIRSIGAQRGQKDIEQLRGAR